MGYDLTLSRPSTRRDRAHAEATLTALRAECAGANAWQPRLAFTEPDDGDRDLVADLLAEGGDTGAAFMSFCHSRGVDVGAAVRDAALCAEFTDLQWGARLVTVSLPRVQPEAAWAALVAFARRHCLSLHDPQAGHDVDLANAGTLPSRY